MNQIADPEHRYDKLGLFVLAGLALIVLAIIAGGVFFRGTVPDKGDVLLATIATGLLLFLRDLVNAVRSSWEAVTQAKTMDALGKSQPADGKAPQEVKVINKPGEEVPVDQAG